jgi:hypothetical protein
MEGEEAMNWLWQPYQPTASDVAATVEDFLAGTGDPHDWDDFTSIEITNDPYLEGIRLKCVDIRRTHPPVPGSLAYCSQQGMDVLKEIVSELRARRDTLAD